MNLSGRTADKLTFAAIYLAAALFVVWGGRRTMDYARDAVFYRDYLMSWEVQLTAMRYRAVQWPRLSAGNPVAYMQEIVRLMQTNGVQPPASNTADAFIYRLNAFGDRDCNLLLVFRDSQIVLYGLPRETFDRLDKFIDGRVDPQHGVFTGRWSVDGQTRIGHWKI